YPRTEFLMSRAPAATSTTNAAAVASASATNPSVPCRPQSTKAAVVNATATRPITTRAVGESFGSAIGSRRTASGTDINKSRTQRHSGAQGARPAADERPPPIDVYAIQAIHPMNTAMEKPMNVRTTGARKLLVSVAHSYILCTADHASGAGAAKGGASRAKADSGRCVIGVPEKRCVGTPSAAKIVGAMSVLLTMPARRVVLDVMSPVTATPPPSSDGVAPRSLGSTATASGAKWKPCRRAAAGGDGLTTNRS